LRVVSQISVTTSEQASEKLGYKYVLAQVGSTDVLLAFSYRLDRSRQTDWITQGAGSTYKYEAPKGHKIWYVFCKTSSGTSTLDLVASDMDIEAIS